VSDSDKILFPASTSSNVQTDHQRESLDKIASEQELKLPTSPTSSSEFDSAASEKQQNLPSTSSDCNNIKVSNDDKALFPISTLSNTQNDHQRESLNKIASEQELKLSRYPTSNNTAGSEEHENNKIHQQHESSAKMKQLSTLENEALVSKPETSTTVAASTTVNKNGDDANNNQNLSYLFGFAVMFCVIAFLIYKFY